MSSCTAARSASSPSAIHGSYAGSMRALSTVRSRRSARPCSSRSWSRGHPPPVVSPGSRRGTRTPRRRRPRPPSAARLARLVRIPDHHHRAGSVPDDRVRDAAEEQGCDRPVAARADRDQAGVDRASVGADLARGITGRETRLDPYPGGGGSCGRVGEHSLGVLPLGGQQIVEDGRGRMREAVVSLERPPDRDRDDLVPRSPRRVRWQRRVRRSPPGSRLSRRGSCACDGSWLPRAARCIGAAARNTAGIPHTARRSAGLRSAGVS